MQNTSAAESLPVRLDPVNRCLWRQGVRLPLTPKDFAVLHTLVRHQGDLVTKADLLEAVWPGTYIGEEVLKGYIRRLRRALGDQARRPRFIETVHRHGYRLIGEILLVTEASTSPEATSHTYPRPPPAWMVGRQDALDVMQDWLARARQGQRQVGFVSGEVGIGKTTVVEALLSANREVPLILHGQCVEHYGTGEAYLPVLDALRQVGQRSNRDRYLAVLRQYAPTWLQHLPGLVDTEAPTTHQDQPASTTRDHMLRELADGLDALGTETPVVLVLEDLHWSDASTLDLLTFMAQRRTSGRLLLVGSFRPEEVLANDHPLRAVLTTLRRLPQVHELSLTALSERDVAAYLTTRFQTENLPLALTHDLHQRSEGNPLFLVTLTDHLVAQDVFTQRDGQWTLQDTWEPHAAEVPSTLWEVVVQRQSLCSPNEQRLLAVASVAGMTFSAASVAAGLEADVIETEACCEGLAQRGLLLQAQGEAVWPDGTAATQYGFRHALYQQVLYEQVPAAQRVQWHRSIAEREEQGYGEQAADIAARLALHFERGRDNQRAVTYHQQAAQKAVQRGGFREAIRHVTAGLELLRCLPDTPKRAAHDLALHHTLGVSQGFAAPRVEQAYGRAWTLSQQGGGTPEPFPVLWGLFTFHFGRGAFQTAREVGSQLLTLAKHQDNPMLLRAAYQALGHALFFVGAFPAAREHLGHVTALVHSNPRPALAVRTWRWDPGVMSRALMAQTLWCLGHPDQALRQIFEACTRAQDLADPHSRAVALYFAAQLHLLRGEVIAAQKQSEAAIAVTTELGLAYRMALATFLHGWTLAAQGRDKEGVAQMQQGMATCQARGNRTFRPFFLTLLAEAFEKAGQVDEGLCLLTEALAIADETGGRYYKAESYRLYGNLLLQQGKRQRAHGTRHTWSKAEESFDQALDIARRQQAKSLELRAATSLARLRQSQDKRQEAYDLLAPVYGWFTEGFDTADLREAKTLLDELAP